MKIMSVIQCFEILECKGKYCMPLENVQHCFSVVDTVKQLVFTQMNLKENELV